MLRSLRTLLTFAIALASALPLAAADKETGKKLRVELEVVADEHIPITAPQEWQKILGEAGFTHLSIRRSKDRVNPAVEKEESKKDAYYAVTGVITADNALHLPKGKKFTTRDKAMLKQWLADLNEGGIEGIVGGRPTFGLLANQAREVTAEMKQPLDFDTKGQSVTELIQRLSPTLGATIYVDSSTAQKLGDVKLSSDLRGLSRGTALAIALETAGYVFAPDKPANGERRYIVFTSRAMRESWPSGHVVDDSENDPLPGRLEFLKVEIDHTPLPEALGALAGRLETSFVMDDRALAAQQIDPTKIEVTLPEKRMTYSMIITKVLSQAKLKAELRVDDAGKAYYWVTPIKRTTGGGGQGTGVGGQGS